MLLAYEIVNNNLSPKPREHSKMPIPASLIAGACAGVCSTICTYPKIFKKYKIGNIETLLIGSAAGAFSGSATFPLEVARKHMQVRAVNGRKIKKNVIHAHASILEQEGILGLYKGLGPSCMNLVPTAGISFMCYEACKRILVEDDDDEE
ncbi:hypothetical protein JHK87_018934 [Glycine soja]|nr:hypothetical protein JHK87_018934 [Glycine soja]